MLIETEIYEGYHCFFFSDTQVVVLREIIQNFSAFFGNKHLLVISIDCGKIDSELQQYMNSKGVIGEYIDGNLVVQCENSKEFLHYLFSEGEGGSTIFFITKIPHREDLKDIDKIPQIFVSYPLFKRQQIEPELLRTLLQKLMSLNADAYYHNDFVNTFFIVKDENIANNLRAFYSNKG